MLGHGSMIQDLADEHKQLFLLYLWQGQDAETGDGLNAHPRTVGPRTVSAEPD